MYTYMSMYTNVYMVLLLSRRENSAAAQVEFSRCDRCRTMYTFVYIDMYVYMCAYAHTHTHVCI